MASGAHTVGTERSEFAGRSVRVTLRGRSATTATPGVSTVSTLATRAPPTPPTPPARKRARHRARDSSVTVQRTSSPTMLMLVSETHTSATPVRDVDRWFQALQHTGPTNFYHELIHSTATLDGDCVKWIESLDPQSHSNIVFVLVRLVFMEGVRAPSSLARPRTISMQFSFGALPVTPIDYDWMTGLQVKHVVQALLYAWMTERILCEAAVDMMLRRLFEVPGMQRARLEFQTLCCVKELWDLTLSEVLRQGSRLARRIA
jgi:hypothetical protein